MARHDSSSNDFESPRPAEHVRASDRRFDWRDHIDLAGATALAVIALVAALNLEARDMFRVVLVAPFVLVVPGYLLIQAVMGRQSRLRRRGLHALVGLGVTPAVMALVGLLAAVSIPGGFRPTTVLVTMTMFCMVCASVAAARRAWPASRQTAGSGSAVD